MVDKNVGTVKIGLAQYYELMKFYFCNAGLQKSREQRESHNSSFPYKRLVTIGRQLKLRIDKNLKSDHFGKSKMKVLQQLLGTLLVLIIGGGAGSITAGKGWQIFEIFGDGMGVKLEVVKT